MKDFTKQLNSLKEIQPSTKWKDSAREDILAQIMCEDSPQKLGLLVEFLYFIRFSGRFFNDFIAKPVGTLALVLVLVFGGGVIKVKADSSLPGDLFYSLKRSGEKVHIAFMFDEEKKSDLRLSLMSERVRELNEVIYKKDLEQSDKIKKAFENFHKDFTPVRESIASIDDNSENRLSVAQKVEDKTSELSFILSNVKNKIEDEMAGEVVMAINNVNMVNLGALEVIAGDTESNKSDVMARKIDNKIDEVVNMISDTDASNEVFAKLDEAKEELVVGNFVAALQKVRESNEMISSDNDKNTTSTDDINESIEEIGDDSDVIVTSTEAMTEGVDDDFSVEPTSTIEFFDNTDKNSTTTSSKN